jgi:hypothetical protein
MAAISTRELRAARTRYLAARKRESDAQAALHAAIRDAHASGMSIRAIATEVEVSYQRVGQIVRTHDG